MSDAPSGADGGIASAFAARYGDGSRRLVARAPEGDAFGGVAAHDGGGHWHLVTLGLADAAPPAREGREPGPPLGHELSLLVPGGERPPAWAFALVDGAARTALAVGRPFHAGARLAPGAPVDGAGSALVALGVRDDPVVVPAGPVALLQLVGVTDAEFRLMQRVGTTLVLERLAVRDPLLLTDPTRGA